MDVLKRMRSRFSQGRRSSVDPVRMLADESCVTDKKHRSGIPRLAVPSAGKRRSSSSDRCHASNNWNKSRTCNDGPNPAGILFTPQLLVTPRVESTRHAIDSISQLSAKSHTARKEQRGALDKAALVRISRHVANYLNRTGLVGDLLAGGQGRALSGAIEPSDLKNLNKSAFLTLFNLLYKELGPRSRVDFNPTNYIEKILMITKRLNYSGAIYKSHLLTPNTPHSWPYVIALLGWLVDLVEAQQPYEELLNDEIETEEMVFKEYLLKSYLAWLEGQSSGPPPEEYNQTFRDKICLLRNIQPEVIEELQEERDRVTSMVDAETENVNAIKEETKNLNDKMKADVKEIERLSGHIENWGAEKATNVKKNEEAKKFNEQLVLQLEELRRENEHLRVVCSQQSFSKPQWDLLVAEKKEIQASIQLIHEKCENCQKKIDSVDLRMSSNRHKLDKFVIEIVEACGTVQPDSELIKHLFGQIHQFNHRSPEALQNFEYLQSTLDRVLEEVSQKVTTKQTKAKSLQDEMLKMNNRSKELNKDAESINKEIEDIKQYLQSIKTQFKEEQDKLTRKIEQFSKEAKFMSESSLDDCVLELQKTKEMYNQCVRAFEESKVQGESCLKDMAEMTATYVKVAMEKLTPFCTEMAYITTEISKYNQQ